MGVDTGLIAEAVLNYTIIGIGLVAFVIGNRVSFHKVHGVWYKGSALK